MSSLRALCSLCICNAASLSSEAVPAHVLARLWSPLSLFLRMCCKHSGFRGQPCDGLHGSCPWGFWSLLGLWVQCCHPIISVSVASLSSPGALGTEMRGLEAVQNWPLALSVVYVSRAFKVTVLDLLWIPPTRVFPTLHTLVLISKSETGVCVSPTLLFMNGDKYTTLTDPGCCCSLCPSLPALPLSCICPSPAHRMGVMFSPCDPATPALLSLVRESQYERRHVSVF